MLNDLDQQARGILASNDRGRYTVPTEELYPYQWNWDSAFAALGIAKFNIDRAWVELETLFSGQWADGMVPHILFHEPDPGYFPGVEVWRGTGPIPSSGISQPPVATSFARRIYEMDPVKGRQPLERLYPRMLAWHDWFMRWRGDQGAICATHPWEAGRDNAPDWDVSLAAINPTGVGEYVRRDTDHVQQKMRPTKEEYDRYIWLVQLGSRLGWDQEVLLKENPFRVADPAMTFICLRAARDLRTLGNLLQLDTSKLDGQIDLLEEGTQTLWNDSLGSYDSRIVPDEFTNCLSSASFLCWYAGLKDEKQLPALRHALSDTAYPIASHDPASDRFDAFRYWRGPTWAFMNMLIGIGLEEQGYAESEILRSKTREMISRSGFFEYFNPLTGEAAGGSSFAWTAAVWLAWTESNSKGA